MDTLIKCPHCGSEDYDTYDTCGGGNPEQIFLCVCNDCEKQFKLIFKLDHIEKE